MGEIIKQFDTFQPALVKPNNITTFDCFNGMCLVRRYKVTVEEYDEPGEVIARLRTLWAERDERRIRHGANLYAMLNEARKLGITLE